MFGKIIAVLALAASSLVAGVTPSLAGNKSSPSDNASFSGWYDTNSNAAGSRANLIENVLSPAVVPKVKYLRSVVSPLNPPWAQCIGQLPIVAPLPAGRYLYAITNGTLSKYNPATGSLIWRRTPDPGFDVVYESLAISGNILIVGGFFCGSQSEPGGALYAYNASTGALLWKGGGVEGLTQAVIAGSYVVESGDDAAGYSIAVLNLLNGNQVWNGGNCYPNNSNPMVVDQVVMGYDCDSQGNTILEGLRLATGSVLWSLPAGWTIQAGDLAGSGGAHLYVTDPSGTVKSLNPLTGQAAYSLSGAVKVLAVDTSRVYAKCGGGNYVCAYNIGTGALEWQDTQLFPIPALGAEADGVLYLDTGLALNAATGKVIKQVWLSNSPATAIAVGGGRIAVVSDPRALDLFGLKGY